MMTYGKNGLYDAAYTYGLERIEVEDLDETRTESQDPLYYLYDGLGSVAYMVKPDGNTRDHYRYDEFGKPAPGNSKQSPDGDINLNNTFGYTGEMWDEESGLLYLRARYYEPETGRFLSRDTYEGELENPISKHLYAYVQNNPVNAVDPTGHVTIIVHGIRAGNLAGPNSLVKFLRDQHIPDVHVYDWRKFYTNWGLGNYAAGSNSKVPADLAKHIKWWAKPGKPLNIIAHSAGGEMSILAAYLLEKNWITINNLILLDAPMYHIIRRPYNVKKIYYVTSLALTSLGSQKPPLWRNAYGYTIKGWVGHTEFWTDMRVRMYIIGALKN